MIVDKIYQFISAENTTIDEALLDSLANIVKWSFKRQFVEKRQESTTISLSQCGKCPRSLAYKRLGYPNTGKQMDSRSALTFWYGDTAENCVVCLAKASGVPLEASGAAQREISLKIGENVVLGHPDGIVGDCLFECKSMSSFAYEKFERGEVDDSYLAQINIYMDCLGLTKCVLVAFNKESNVMAEQTITKDEVVVKNIKESLTTVFNATKENLPDRWYGANEKGFLPWQCAYCSFWGECFPNAEKVVVGKSYKLKLKKEVTHGRT